MAAKSDRPTVNIQLFARNFVNCRNTLKLKIGQQLIGNGNGCRTIPILISIAAHLYIGCIGAEFRIFRIDRQIVRFTVDRIKNRIGIGRRIVDRDRVRGTVINASPIGKRNIFDFGKWGDIIRNRQRQRGYRITELTRFRIVFANKAPTRLFFPFLIPRHSGREGVLPYFIRRERKSSNQCPLRPTIGSRHRSREPAEDGNDHQQREQNSMPSSHQNRVL